MASRWSRRLIMFCFLLLVACFLDLYLQSMTSAVFRDGTPKPSRQSTGDRGTWNNSLGGSRQRGSIQDNAGDTAKPAAPHRVDNKKRGEFNFSSVCAHGGNTLPNFFLSGSEQGLSSNVYRQGIIMFLHHNKAAGSTVSECLSSMVGAGIPKTRRYIYMSSATFTRIGRRDISKHGLFSGGYTFDLCEYFGGENCSYFTFLRDPYDRVLSSYFFCAVKPSDQLCGPLGVRRFTLEQWAVYQGSYFFYQLLMNASYCKPNEVVSDLTHDLASNSSLNESTIPPGAGRYISPKSVSQCWFKQRIFLNKFVNETGREVLLQHVLDNLEAWFAVIGLTEEYDLSMRMLSAAYGIPFHERCQERVDNRNKKAERGESREKLREQLMRSPRVVEAMRYDVMIYERGREIFRRQRQQLEIPYSNRMERT